MEPVTGRGRQRVRAILWSALSVRRLETGICPQLRSGACDQSWHWISWHPPLLISFPDRNKKIMPDPDEGPVHWSLVTSSSEWGQRPNCHFPDKWKLGGSAQDLLGKYSHLPTLYSPHPSASQCAENVLSFISSPFLSRHFVSTSEKFPETKKPSQGSEDQCSFALSSSTDPLLVPESEI